MNVENKDRNEIETIPRQNMEKCIEENKQQQHDTVLDHKEEEPISLKDILKLHHEVAADIELKIRNEDNFLKTYRKIVTKCRGQSPVASLASAFVHFGKQQSNNLIPELHNGSRIRVQPTSISRRKSLFFYLFIYLITLLLSKTIYTCLINTTLHNANKNAIVN